MPKLPSQMFEPAPSPVVEPTPAPPKTASNPLLTVVIVALFAVLMWGVWQRWDGGGGDRDQDHQEQKDDDKKQDDKKEDKKAIVAKPGYLMIVRERQDPPMAEEQAVLRIVDFVSKQTFPDGKLEFRDIDEEDNTPAVQIIIAHAKRQNIDPPFVVHKSTDNVLGTVIKLPAATAPESELMEVFK